MREAQIIQSTPEPRTRRSLAEDLLALGIAPGTTVLVHSSLSALGWVSGGPVAVVQALMDVLTPHGTLVMPAFSGYSDPAYWENPPVPRSWVPVIHQTMPAFEPETAPTRGMGAIAESFRSWPGVLRSRHPLDSFCAWGSQAERVTADHAMDDGLGEGSPLARLYELGAHVLLLGVGFDSNTSFHLAEHRAPRVLRRITQRVPLLGPHGRQLVTIREIDYSTDDFVELGETMQIAGQVRIGWVGSAASRLFAQPACVDFASEWFRRHPQQAAAAGTPP
jgi:aminoglycoside 3-N-acetyltransferase